MLTPVARRVISRTRRLKRAKDFGAIARLISGPSVKLNPRNFRSCGLATALLDSFTLSIDLTRRETAILYHLRDGIRQMVETLQQFACMVEALGF